MKNILLALLLCAQISSTELYTHCISPHQDIESFESEKNVDQLLFLMQKRLVIMHEVARSKWKLNLPIEDKMREEQVLIALSDKASQYHLDQKWVVHFFRAQIEAAKEIQKMDFALWQEENVKFEEVLSLKDDLRVYIDQINHEMLEALRKIFEKEHTLSSKCILSRPISARISDYVHPDVWLMAIAPLQF